MALSGCNSCCLQHPIMHCVLSRHVVLSTPRLSKPLLFASSAANQCRHSYLPESPIAMHAVKDHMRLILLLARP